MAIGVVEDRLHGAIVHTRRHRKRHTKQKKRHVKRKKRHICDKKRHGLSAAVM
jgi:hypothetical protein